jgi:hypothetical protein
MKPKSLFFFKIATQFLIVCLAAVGIVGCHKKDPSDVILPGRHLSQNQASSLALAAFPSSSWPQGEGLITGYKDGIYEILGVPFTRKDGKPVLIETNRLQVFVRVRDIDGKVEIADSPEWVQWPSLKPYN